MRILTAICCPWLSCAFFPLPFYTLPHARWILQGEYESQKLLRVNYSPYMQEKTALDKLKRLWANKHFAVAGQLLQARERSNLGLLRHLNDVYTSFGSLQFDKVVESVTAAKHQIECWEHATDDGSYKQLSLSESKKCDELSERQHKCSKKNMQRSRVVRSALMLDNRLDTSNPMCLVTRAYDPEDFTFKLAGHTHSKARGMKKTKAHPPLNVNDAFGKLKRFAKAWLGLEAESGTDVELWYCDGITGARTKLGATEESFLALPASLSPVLQPNQNEESAPPRWEYKIDGTELHRHEIADKKGKSSATSKGANEGKAAKKLTHHIIVVPVPTNLIDWPNGRQTPLQQLNHLDTDSFQHFSHCDLPHILERQETMAIENREKKNKEKGMNAVECKSVTTANITHTSLAVVGEACPLSSEEREKWEAIKTQLNSSSISHKPTEQQTEALKACKQRMKVLVNSLDDAGKDYLKRIERQQKEMQAAQKVAAKKAAKKAAKNATNLANAAHGAPQGQARALVTEEQEQHADQTKKVQHCDLRDLPSDFYHVYTKVANIMQETAAEKRCKFEGFRARTVDLPDQPPTGTDKLPLESIDSLLEKKSFRAAQKLKIELKKDVISEETDALVIDEIVYHEVDTILKRNFAGVFAQDWLRKATHLDAELSILLDDNCRLATTWLALNEASCRTLGLYQTVLKHTIDKFKRWQEYVKRRTETTADKLQLRSASKRGQ